MKVKICAGARCTMNSSENLAAAVEDLQRDLNAYMEKHEDHLEEFEIEFVNCLDYCKEDHYNAPVVVVNDKPILGATPEVLMERLTDEVFADRFDD